MLVAIACIVLVKTIEDFSKVVENRDFHILVLDTCLFFYFKIFFITKFIHKFRETIGREEETILTQAVGTRFMNSS